MQSSERGKREKFSGSWYTLGYNLHQPPCMAENPPPNFMIGHLLRDLYGADSPAVKCEKSLNYTTHISY